MAGGKTPTNAKTSTGSNAPRNNMPLILGIVGGVALLALIAVFLLNPSGGLVTLEDQTAAVAIDGVSLPLMPQQAVQDTSANGLTPPSLSGEDFAGNPVSITDDGRAKAIVFVAHWCPHCQQEVPRVQAWLDSTGGNADVDLYSVSTAVRPTGTNFPPSEWLDTEGWEVPVIVDDADGSAHLAYGAGGFPYWVFLNSDGTVAMRTSGELTTDQLEQTLNALH